MLLRKILTLTLTAFILSVSPGCALLSGSKDTKVDFRCVLEDERLGAPFTDPARAREWLVDTQKYLKAMGAKIEAKEWVPTAEDLARLADLADLVARAESCLN